MGLKLDLACGQRKREGFMGVDCVDVSGVDFVLNLEEYPWPFEDNSVEEVHCSHYVEHTPTYRPDGQDGLIAFMNELWRVCEPGAKVSITHPHFKSERAFRDPTHRRFITPQTWLYFSKEWRVNSELDHYPITADFSEIRVGASVPGEAPTAEQAIREWDRLDDLFVEMRAVK